MNDNSTSREIPSSLENPATPEISDKFSIELAEILYQEEENIANTRKDLQKQPSDFLTAGAKQNSSEANRLWAELNQAREEFKRLTPEPDDLDKKAQYTKAKDKFIQTFRKYRSEVPRGAICCSGGGIRSACINLGVMQGLAGMKGMAGMKGLAIFDYLSTVSGGGYIGCWLSTWIHSERLNLPPSKENPKACGSADLIETKLASTKNGVEAEEITNLRVYSNYLTPRAGALSVDFLTCLTIVARNMVVNWLVLIPFFALCLAVPVVVMLCASACIDFLKGAELGWLAGWAAVVFLTVNGYLASMLMPGVAGNAPKKGEPLAKISDRYSHLLAIRIGLSLLAALGLAIWLKAIPADPGESFISWNYLPLYGLISIPYVMGVIVYKEKNKGTGIAGEGKGLAPQAGVAFPANKPDAIPRKAIWGFLMATLISYVAASGVISALHPPPLLISGWFHQISPNFHDTLYLVFAPLAWILFFLFQNFLLVGNLSMITDDEDREWWSRSNAVLLLWALVWTVVSIGAIYGPALYVLYNLNHADLAAFFAAHLSIGGIIALLAAGGKTPATDQDAPAPLRLALLTVGAMLFFLVLAFLLAWLNYHVAATVAKAYGDPTAEIAFPAKAIVSEEGTATVERSSDRLRVTVSLAPPDRPQEKKSETNLPLEGMSSIPNWLMVIGFWSLCSAVAGTVVNINQFSIQCLYRNRLVRCFIGAVRRSPDFVNSVEHRYEPFTGFDEDDNYEVEKLKDQLPFHVFNMAQNLISPTNLAWQERRATSFTVSPLHTGGKETGYRPTDLFGDNISIGTAMATSGAAANPSMGHCSSPVLALLMTLFNVRLGWWVGNPKLPEVWKKIGPEFALSPLLSEMFGQTTEGQTEVLLSDGGHFEDLGIYEMIQRRCRFLIVVDGGADPKGVFEDLGNAVRKVRIDQGVEIKFIFNRTTRALTPTKAECQHFAVAKIKYSDVDSKVGGTQVTDGWLLYIKGVLTGDEPADVYQYKQFNQEFPHQSTADQWFDESQFESYRALGQHSIEKALGVIKSYPSAPMTSKAGAAYPPCFISEKDVGPNKAEFQEFVTYINAHFP